MIMMHSFSLYQNSYSRRTLKRQVRQEPLAELYGMVVIIMIKNLRAMAEIIIARTPLVDHNFPNLY